MPPCEAIQQGLLQFVADGEPTAARYEHLRAHVRQCPQCRQRLYQIYLMEDALRGMPLESVPPELHTRVMRSIKSWRAAAEETWQPLPWPVLVPLLTLLTALATILMLPPARLLSESWSTFAAGSVGIWVSTAVAWLESLHDLRDSQVLWAIWSGLFAVCAGLGLLLSLSSWDTRASQGWRELGVRVSEAASRVWSLGRRAH